MSSDVTKRNRANKRRGGQWEVDNVNGFRDNGYAAERTRLAGVHDEGDLSVDMRNKFWYPHVLVAETKNVAKIDLAGFVAEAITEADNYARRRPIWGRERVLGAAIIKRRMKSWEDAYVLTTVREMFLRGRS